MTRLEGQKPNTGAIIIGAVIFALIAAGLFFAFRPVPEPTDAGLSNSAAPTDSANSAGGANAADANSTNGASANSLTTILTPLPLATPDAATPDNATNATADNAATAPVAASNEAVPGEAMTNSALSSEVAPATNSVMAPASP